MDTYKIQLAKDQSLGEIYQSVSMRFAFAKIEKQKETTLVKQLHPFVKCRDFLGDAMWSTKFKKSYGIYSFRFDGSKESVQLNKTVMLIEYKDIEAVKQNIKVLHHFEKSARWRKTSLVDIKTNNSNGIPIVLAVGSPVWMRSPALISLYTMLHRLAGIGIKEEETVDDFIIRCSKVNTNDGKYIKLILTKGKEMGLKRNPIYSIMRRSKVIFENAYEFGENAQSHHIHHKHGILNLMKNTTAYKGNNLNVEIFANKWAKNFVDLIDIKQPVSEKGDS